MRRNNKNVGEKRMDIQGIHFHVPMGFRDAARRFADEHGLRMRELLMAGMLAQMEAGRPADINALKMRIERLCGGQEAA
jgi:hypothetical protein